MSTTEKLPVKFLHAWRGYSAGEIAGFDEKVAVQLVKSKVAEEYAVEGDKASATQTTARQAAQRQAANNKRGKTDVSAPAPGSSEGSPAGDSASAADSGQTDATGPTSGSSDSGQAGALAGAAAGSHNDARP